MIASILCVSTMGLISFKDSNKNIEFSYKNGFFCYNDDDKLKLFKFDAQKFGW